MQKNCILYFNGQKIREDNKDESGAGHLFMWESIYDEFLKSLRKGSRGFKNFIRLSMKWWDEQIINLLKRL